MRAQCPLLAQGTAPVMRGWVVAVPDAQFNDADGGAQVQGLGTGMSQAALAVGEKPDPCGRPPLGVSAAGLAHPFLAFAQHPLFHLPQRAGRWLVALHGSPTVGCRLRECGEPFTSYYGGSVKMYRRADRVTNAFSHRFTRIATNGVGSERFGPGDEGQEVGNGRRGAG
jgi:hypothetical protein